MSQALRETVYSVGHSTRSGDDLLALLREAGVRTLADVRRFPGSRRHPWFAREALATQLGDAGIGYLWLGQGLGGRVRETVEPEASPNRAWSEPAFRRYADAMPSEVFRRAFAELEARAREAPTAFLCAERLWWRCHRRLLADYLVARGWRVVHLLDPGRADEHTLSAWARVGRDGALTYPSLV